jgi:DNA polymerase-3 subunit beta
VKFRLERDVIADAVAWTARTLPTRPSMPMLAGLLIEATDQQIMLSSFDYEVSGRVSIDADVLEPGRVLVSGRLLADISRSLPAAPVTLSVDGSRVEVTCGRSSFTLPTLPVDDYPSLPDMPGSSGTVPGSVFAHAVAQVAIAAGRDDTLPTLTGVRVEILDNTITLAATDRYRLAVREFPWAPASTGMDVQALVPARTLADTAKSLVGCDEIHLALAASGGDGLMGFEGGGRRTTTRLLDGEFPKYRALLPAESSTVAMVDTGALVDAVKRVSLVAERNTPVRLLFADGEVELRAGTGDEAQANESLECTVEGAAIEIAFNPTYLLDGLGALDDSTTRLSFTTATRPAVLTGGSQVESPSYRYLLMPVRLSS